MYPSSQPHKAFFPQSESHICAKYTSLALPTPAEIKGQLELQIPFNRSEAGGVNRALARLTSGGRGRSYSTFLKVIQLFKHLKP